MSLTFASNLTKMIDAGLGGEVIAPDTSVAIGYRMQYNLVSGPVASWNDPEGGLPINLIAAIEPIQDLHGQANPYPAGGGKNLLQVTATSQTQSGVTITVAEDGTISLNGTASSAFSVDLGTVSLKGGVEYIVNGCPTGGGGSVYDLRVRDSNYTVLVFDVGSGNSFTPDADGTYYVAFIVRENINVSGKTVKPMIRLASVSDATFAPYSNICPISGRTDVNIWHDATHDTSAEPTLIIQLGDTIYGGSLDVTNGVMTVEWANIASYDGETLPGEWISDRDVYAPGTTPTTGAQVCYKLAEPLTVQLSPQTITSLLGQNNVWSDAGDVSVTWKEKLYTEGY